jgi:hypothetical protein
MLLGNFELAVSDLIARLRNLPAHDFKSSGDIGDVYVGMSEAFFEWKISNFSKRFQAISKSIRWNRVDSPPRHWLSKPFDGEEAYQFKFEDRWQLFGVNGRQRK